MRPSALIALRASAFRDVLTGWVDGSGFEPYVTDVGRYAIDWVRGAPGGISFFDRDLERLDGTEVWRLARPTVGHRLVLMAEQRTKELWFSALAEGVVTILPLPAERDAVLSALRLASGR
jgi:DNA-binding NtrC family response regulator